ncbi:type I glutamate--ammonia ligase [bacterium]|nr:type I glutamate--ammonia ligase [bacterium]
MFANKKEALEYISAKNISAVDLKFVDLLGKWHHVTILSKQVNEALFEEGVGVDGSSIGFKGVEAGDMVIIPDCASAFIDPFWDNSTLSFICNIHDADSGEPFIYDPRTIARKTELFLEKLDLGESLWLPELEFYVFEDADFAVQKCSSYFFIKPLGKNHPPSIATITPKEHRAYHAVPPEDNFFNLREQIADKLVEAGINVKYHHHEVGVLGQMEIEIDFHPLLKTCDNIMLAKYFTKMVAYKNGMAATFMPKPFPDEPGNGMHFHQFLQKDGKSLFFGNEYANLSKLALQYTAGLLKHTPALLALTNPTTNSYKRLLPGFEAPTALFFGVAHRAATIRIPKYSDNSLKKRIEYRPSDATSNPYLAVPAMLLAGLNGISNKMDPQELGFGPISDNIDKWKPEELAKLNQIPSSLTEALFTLQNNHSFLTENGIFPNELIRIWVDLKSKEALELNKLTHPYEMVLYFDY